jgi:hypothetical protein
MLYICGSECTTYPGTAHGQWLQVREKIETSGRDARWEFSKATLFARSNYMAEVCGHLSEMVEIVDDFFKFLGPELKAVTGVQSGAALLVHVRSAAKCITTRCSSGATLYAALLCASVEPDMSFTMPFLQPLPSIMWCACAGDTKGIDDVIEHVQLMVEPVETAMFDVFDQVHAPQWQALRAHFYADNEKVKSATRELIDTSFRKLRSAEGAFELLQVRI